MLFDPPVSHPLCRAAQCPGLIFMTADHLGTDFIMMLKGLPVGTLVIFRHYQAPDRADLAAACVAACRAYALKVFIAGEAALETQLGADGVHLPGHQLRDPAFPRPAGLVSAACHCRDDLLRAQALAVDLALVSPLFDTASHPGARALGVDGFRALTQGISLPFVALGGIKAETAPLLSGLDLAAVAGISALL